MSTALARKVFALTTQGTGNGQSAAVALDKWTREIVVVSDVTAEGGTATFDVKAEWSVDGGTTWFEPSTPDALTQQTAVGIEVATFTVKAPLVRLDWTVAGTTPTITGDGYIQELF